MLTSKYCSTSFSLRFLRQKTKKMLWFLCGFAKYTDVHRLLLRLDGKKMLCIMTGDLRSVTNFYQLLSRVTFSAKTQQ